MEANFCVLFSFLGYVPRSEIGWYGVRGIVEAAVCPSAGGVSKANVVTVGVGTRRQRRELLMKKGNASNVALAGPVPEGLNKLAALRVLDLSNNKLSGERHPFLGQSGRLTNIPTCLSSLLSRCNVRISRFQHRTGVRLL